MADSRPRSFSRPVFDQTLYLRSEHAQRVMLREFPRVVNALYTIDVILQVIVEPEESDRIESLVAAMISRTVEEITIELARFSQLKVDHGITDTPRYTHPGTLNVRIVSPQVAQFVALVNCLDDLMVCLDSLWLSGVLSNRQRADGVHLWQQTILRLGRRIVGIEQRARITHRQSTSSSTIAGPEEEVVLEANEQPLDPLEEHPSL